MLASGVTTSDIIAASSFVLAAIALGVTLYTQFWRPARLFAWVKQITTMRVPLQQNRELLVQMLQTDLLRDAPSPTAVMVMHAVPQIGEAVRQRDIDKLRRLVAIEHLARFNYLPPEDLIEQFGIEGRIPLSFSVTASITNTGGRYAHIGSLVLTAESVAHPVERWYFGSYMLMNMPLAIDPSFQGHEMQRFAGLFSGISIAPGSTTKVDVQFLAHHTSAGKQLTSGNMRRGSYKMSIAGYDADMSKPPSMLVRSAAFEYPFTDVYKTIFTGGEWAFLVGLEEHVLDAFTRNAETKTQQLSRWVQARVPKRLRNWRMLRRS